MGALYAFLLLLCLIPREILSWDQRCYYDVDKLADDYIIPCYSNPKTVQYACCKKGNVCLEDGACWDKDTGVTYQYGCTDPLYKDGRCPQKCGLDRELSHWTGLVYCNGLNGTPNNTWICHHPQNCGNKCPDHQHWDDALERPNSVTCKDLDSDKKAIDAGSQLDSVVTLPADDAGLSSWFAANPTATSSGPRSSTVSTPTVAESATAAPTSSAEPPKEDHTATYVALGVSMPFMLAAMGALGYFLHKHRKAKTAAKADIGQDDRSNPGFGSKSELAADERQVYELPESRISSSTERHSAPHGFSPVHSTFTTMDSPMESEFSNGDGRREHRGRVISEIYSSEVYELPG